MRIASTAAIVTAIAGSASAQVILYNGPGAGLIGHPNATFPNGVPGTTGSSLNFVIPTGDAVTLQFDLGVLPAGTVVKVEAQVTGQTGDFDLHTAVSGGGVFTGNFVADYDRYIGATDGTYNGTNLTINNFGVTTNNGSLPMTYVVSHDFTLGAAGTQIDISSGLGAHTQNSATSVVGGNVYLLLALNTTNEVGLLDHLFVCVPTPGTAALAGLGGLVALRRRR